MNYLFFLLVASFWGGSFVAIKIVISVFPPLIGAALRLTVALLSLGIIFLVMRKPLILPKDNIWKSWLTGAFAQAIPFSLLFWGERHVSAGMAGIGNGTVPIWTLLIGNLFLGDQEAYTARKLCGLALGAVGILIIFIPIVNIAGTRDELLGTIAVFGMAASYGVAAVLNRLLMVGSKPIDFHANLFQQHCASLSLIVLECFLVGERLSPRLLFSSSTLTLSIVYLGLCSTAIAWILFYHLIKEWGAFRAASVTYLVPAMAIILDFAVFRNLPSLAQAIGALIILSGVILIQRPRQSPAAVASHPTQGSRASAGPRLRDGRCAPTFPWPPRP